MYFSFAIILHGVVSVELCDDECGPLALCGISPDSLL